jgi:hypothetical protein
VNDDTFGIGLYIDGLCRFITECDTPMTISIQGDWGSGKTSFMNMIRERISRETFTLWFNTWQFSQYGLSDSLAICLLNNLLKDLSVGDEKIRAILGSLAGTAKNVSLAILEKILGGVVTGKIDEAMDAGGIQDVAETLRTLKEKYQEAIGQKLAASGKNRAVIFIDDLDRLQSEKAVEILEALKIFLDCENCIYLLAVDYEVIEQGIAKKFGASVGPKKGKHFFDKIVQLPFKMPVEQYNIQKYAADMLDKMSVSYENHLSAYIDLIRLSIGYNPRNMKRLFNTFLLLKTIAASSERYKNADDAKILDRILFAALCMQMEFDGLYRLTAVSRNILSAEFFFALSDFDEVKSNDDLKEEFADCPDEKIKAMCSFVKAFVGAVSQTEEKTLQPQDIENIKYILFFSSMTSVSGGADIREETGDEWDIRHKNREIVWLLNNHIKNRFGSEFKIYQPRKVYGDTKISDTTGYCSQDGYTIEYQVQRDSSAQKLSLSLYIYPQSGLNAESAVDSFDDFKKDGVICYFRKAAQCNIGDPKDIADNFRPHINMFMNGIKQFFEK